MESVLKQIDELNSGLLAIKSLFTKYPMMESLEVEYYTERDGGDINNFPTALILSGTRVELEEDGLEPGSCDSVDAPLLKVLNDNCYPMFGDTDGNNETIKFLREEMLAFGITEKPLENLMGVDPKLTEGPHSNHVSVLDLIKGFGNDVWNFQSESFVEDMNIITGLENLVDKLKDRL